MCIYDSYKVWSLEGVCKPTLRSDRCCDAVKVLLAGVEAAMQWECVPQVLRAVGVFAGQQNLTESLKGVIKSDEPGGVTL